VATVARAAVRAPLGPVAPLTVFAGLAGAEALVAARHRPRRCWRAVAALSTAVAIAALLPGGASPPARLPRGALLWREGPAAVLLVERPVDGARLLEGLRRGGVRRLDVIVVSSPASSTWREVAPTLDRFDGAVVLTADGARPGTTAAAVGQRYAFGGLVVDVVAVVPRLVVEVSGGGGARSPPALPAGGGPRATVAAA
jgi:hypothetical protein